MLSIECRSPLGERGLKSNTFPASAYDDKVALRLESVD